MVLLGVQHRIVNRIILTHCCFKALPFNRVDLDYFYSDMFLIYTTHTVILYCFYLYFLVICIVHFILDHTFDTEFVYEFIVSF